MPTQVAKEATEYFGNGLTPLIDSILAASDQEIAFSDLSRHGVLADITQAMITDSGKLIQKYAYIEKLRQDQKLAHKKQSALVLGAGMVTGPLVEYLDGNGVQLTLGSHDLAEAENLMARCQTQHASAVQLNLSFG